MEKPHHEETLNRFNCNVCGVKNIHKNNYEAHYNSKRHVFNYTKLQKDAILESKGFYCAVCNQTLTDGDFFKIHLASSGHKKNIRKLTRADTTKTERHSDQGYFNIQSLSVRNIGAIDIGDAAPVIIEQEEEKFIRKKYKIRPDSLAFEQIANHVVPIVSYLSVKLALDPNVKDFQITVNDKRYQSFGDIVIFINLNNKSINFAIKCKQMLTTSKTIDNLKDLKITLDKEYNSIQSLRNQKQYDLTKFVILTSCCTTSNFQKDAQYIKKIGAVNLNIVQTKRNDIINVAEGESIFFLKPEGTIKTEEDTLDDSIGMTHTLEANKNNKEGHQKEESLKKLPPLFIHTNQRVYLPRIDVLLKKNFVNYPSIYKQYHNYIDNWSQGKLGGNYTLTKKDVILKIGEQILEPYVILPKIINFKNNNFEIWNEVIKQVDVIIVQPEPFILSKLCEPFNHIIEETLSVKFDSVTKTVIVNEHILDNAVDPQIKAYLFEEEEDINLDIHFTKMYKVFWKAGKIPLIISLENNEDAKGLVLDVISFMKTQGLQKKFLIKTDEVHNVFKKHQNLLIFSCLEDVKKLVDLENIKIRITKDYSLTLKNVSQSDPFFLNWVTPSIFFDMALDMYTMREERGTDINTENDLKIILDDETIKKVRSLIYGDYAQKENLGRLKGIDPLLI